MMEEMHWRVDALCGVRVGSRKADMMVKLRIPREALNLGCSATPPAVPLPLQYHSAF